jgi:hypothetical protein
MPKPVAAMGNRTISIDCRTHVGVFTGATRGYKQRDRSEFLY